jgi:hypothetical protein
MRSRKLHESCALPTYLSYSTLCYVEMLAHGALAKLWSEKRRDTQMVTTWFGRLRFHTDPLRIMNNQTEGA